MTREEKLKKLSEHCDERECKDCALAEIGCYAQYGDDDKKLDDCLSEIGVTNDTVNHPEHYQGKNECIDVMIAMFGKEAVKHFCMCNAYKYRFRADMKNGEEDIKKAEWYESKLIELGGIDND